MKSQAETNMNVTNELLFEIHLTTCLQKFGSDAQVRVAKYATDKTTLESVTTVRVVLRVEFRKRQLLYTEALGV